MQICKQEENSHKHPPAPSLQGRVLSAHSTKSVGCITMWLQVVKELGGLHPLGEHKIEHNQLLRASSIMRA